MTVVDTLSSLRIRVVLAVLAVLLVPLTGPAAGAAEAAEAAEASVELTLVHAYAPTSRATSETGSPNGPQLDISLDRQRVAAGLGLGGVLVLPDKVPPGPHLVQIRLYGEPLLLQEQEVLIPDTASVDVVVGHSPVGGAGLPYTSVFGNDLSPTPEQTTTLVLRNVADDQAVSLHLFAPSTPDELTGVLRGEEGTATVPAGFSEMSLIPTVCADQCTVLFMQDFATAARTIVYAVGRPGATYEESSFDAVNRVLGQEGGALTVTKVFDAGPSGLTSTFAINVTCPPERPGRTLQLAAGQSLTLVDIPAGSACTVAESDLPAAPAGWTWQEPVLDPPDGAVAIERATAAEVTVTNRISQPPAIDLVKTADVAGFFQAGETISYTFTATNTGLTALSGVRVSDPLPGLSQLTCDADALPPGASLTCTAEYRVTAADVAAGQVRNTATVTGVDPGGATASDSAGVVVTRQLVASGADGPSGTAAAALLLIGAGTAVLLAGRHRTAA